MSGSSNNNFVKSAVEMERGEERGVILPAHDGCYGRKKKRKGGIKAKLCLCTISQKNYYVKVVFFALLPLNLFFVQ